MTFCFKLFFDIYLYRSNYMSESTNEKSMIEKIDSYIAMHREMSELRKKQTSIKKMITGLDAEIKKYMEENDLSFLKSPNGGEIKLYDKKIPQTFKKENIVSKLSEKLHNVPLKDTSVNDLAESIFNNTVFVVEKKIKPLK